MNTENTLHNYKQVQEVLQVAPVGAVQCDMNGDCFFVNKAWEKISGLSFEESLGKKWLRIVLEEDIPAISQVIQQAVNEVKEVTFFYRIRHPKGGIRYLKTTAKPVFDDTGKGQYFTGYIQDVTEKTLSTAQIRSQNRLFGILKDIQDRFYLSESPYELFNTLLQNIIEITESEFGFIGEILPDKQTGQPYLKTLAISNIAWDEKSRKIYEDTKTDGVVFTNLNTLFGQVMQTGETYISNTPATDKKRGGTPKGHPKLRSFIGLPAKTNSELVGMIGIANRKNGYDTSFAEFLSPLLSTFASLVAFHRLTGAKQLADTRKEELNNHLQSLITSLEDIVLEIDGNMVFRNVWVKDEKMLFMPREKFLGKPLPEVFGSQAPFFVKHIGKVIKTGKPSAFEYKHINPAIDKWYKAKVTPVNKAKQPGAYKMAIIIQDITQRTKYIEALKTEKEKLERTNLLFDFSQELSKIGGWEINIKTGKMFWTKQTHIILEISPEELEKISHKQLLDLFEKRGAGLLKKKSREAVAKKNPYDVVSPISTPEGHTKWIRSIGIPIVRNNKVVTLRGAILDITQQKETELALQQTKEKLERSNLLLDASQELSKTGGWENNIKTGEIFWTKQHYNIMGFSPEAIKQMSYKDLFDSVLKEDRHIIEGAFKNSIRKKTTYDATFRIVTPSGEEKWVRSIGFPVLKDGQTYMLRGSIMDITQKKEDEMALIQARDAAENAARAKTDFLSVMSHEIRTPLNGIIGITNLLKLNHTPGQKEYIDNLMFSADHLLQLINDILDLNKIESDKLELVYTEVDLPELILHIRNQFKSLADAKDLTLRCHIDKNIPQKIIGDTVRLSQILNNLVSNAIKFTEKGGVTISLKQLSATPMQSVIHFSVKDTGLGIPQKLQQAIFESFKQIQQAAYRKHSGTGLGLTITKKLIELHDSQIHVKSRPGKGTEFYFDLTLNLPTDKNRKKLSSKTLSAYENKLSGIHLLFVEDNHVNALVARKQLEYFGITPDYARNGDEAIELLRKNYYHMALIDLHMPKMDGYGLSEIIHREYPDINIVIFTADIMTDVRQRLARMGIYDILNKPFVPAEMLSVLLKVAHEKNILLNEGIEG
ncbi:PAS domain-containing protein [Sinomicrobium weinanense]|uniref:histidine kinase n=1 Tax=Sinomicrobium weinanense TaxID=2842200 RepID=A0A926JPC4_9FLAO|nr:PAS domain-containing protein [Sinomicrobium weinanense]MBC9794899.1 PAS domain-containing protein [Sinomicrobium weinanense]MBU3125670.1 PAS domain-containing protein [Sinomicrobium weinanense]